MALVSLRDISINFTGTVLLDKVSMQIEPGERVCLLGRNGEGKSTLLSIIEGITPPDTGSVDYQRGCRVAMLPQEVPQTLEGTVYDITAKGLGEVGEHLAAYHDAARALAEYPDPGQDLVDRLENAQHALEDAGGWPHHQTIETVLSHLKLDGDDLFSSLSGGTKRRVLLARALVSGPELLILDEPTNHLDIDSISWLEDFLLRQNAALLFVTHDRAFLRRLATRIVELDRGRLTSWECDYETYLERKDEALSAEAKQNHNFDRKLAEEETWIRQGIKARRTRNMGRVRDLRKMRAERSARRERVGSVKMVIQEAERTGKLVIEAKDLCFGFDDKALIADFSTTVMRGDKVGLIGPNGAGKTTLLKILLGELTPQSGSVRHGVNLQINYFDQLRLQLDETRSARYNVAEGNDFVDINGNRRHVMSHLKDFLFTPDRAKVPVSVLSGGERNRLLLAKLFTRPSNVLVMDEPTNDLDAETLDLLEELLMDYPGTLLLVSHDRDFLNNVVTSSIAFEGNGRVAEYVGGYDDWLRQRPATAPAPVKACKPKAEPESAPRKAAPAKRKLSYKEKFELEKKREELKAMPARIETLETELGALQERMGSADYYKNSGEVMADDQKRLETLESDLEIAYETWEELETALEGVELD
ncbi:ribosomal protection-like ABC-F family protein [uncultured Pseudodesulfovibrio sp.]|uniref:ribosomal protection-like ABC-F family protein n=1 Tax=uncultured Pseudodesulfovibrio sp. TaxID=2035858 RepID=UPI0029C891DB|nr:ATP-binding cassette domain-containing protein [uncultured Pseudodesulfovibrio sp.]